MIDSVSEVLAVATEVLQEYGDVPGDSRIERMARWVVLNLGVEVDEAHLGSVSRVRTTDGLQRVWRIGSLVGIDYIGSNQGDGNADTARQLAKALLICVERSEQG